MLDQALAAVDGNQAELARRLKRSETTVSRWVNRRNGIDYESALRLARLTALPAATVLIACRLDPDLMPPAPSASATELELRLTRLAAILSRYPRAFWVAIIEACERMATIGDALEPLPEPQPPVSASEQGRVSAQGRRLARGRRGDDRPLAKSNHPLNPLAPAFSFAAAGAV